MNLTSSLQVPTAPLSTAGSSNTQQQAARAGTGTTTGSSLGFDFAQAIADQLQRLVPLQRPTLAADAQTSQDQPAQQPEDNPQPVSDNHTERFDNNASNVSNSNESLQNDTNTSSGSHTHQRARVNAQKTIPSELSQTTDNLPAPLPAVNATAAAVILDPTNLSSSAQTAVPVDTTASSNTTATGSNTPLQMIDLSPQVRIITNPKMAPSPESLAAFAKSMGLDDSAIHNLLGASATTQATTATTATAGASAVANLNLPTAASLVPVSTNVMTNDLQAAGNVLQKLATPNSTAIANSATTPTGGSTVAMQLSAMNVASATATPAASVLPNPAINSIATNPPVVAGMTAADMASIQQLQISVMPAAVAQPATVNASSSSVPSTVSMLSLLGIGISEQDVNALMSNYSDGAGSDTNTQQQTSQGEAGNFAGMSASLTSNAATNATTTEASTKSATNMSDVYDQLSGRMATELAARMHKQLSDGEWKMKFALRPSNLGGVEIQLEMKDGKLDAVFHADNPLTRDLLQNSSQRLREALGNFGINPGQVQIGQGGGNSSQNNSGQTPQQAQVRDNSAVKVSNSDDSTSVTSTSPSNKADASLLDLYA